MKLGIAASTLIACISASAHAETWVPVPDSDYFYEKDSVRRTRNIVSVWQRNNPATSEAYKSNFEIDCDNRKIQMVETHYASGAYAKGTGMPPSSIVPGSNGEKLMGVVCKRFYEIWK